MSADVTGGLSVPLEGVVVAGDDIVVGRAGEPHDVSFAAATVAEDVATDVRLGYASD